jgi:glutaminyl-peptide cyclotransferase
MTLPCADHPALTLRPFGGGKRWLWGLLGVLCIILGVTACQPTEKRFSGKNALAHVKAQCDLGPRPVGSVANRKASDYIGRTLQRYGWEVEYQEFAYQGQRVRNVIGKKGKGPLVILGAHFDTRPVADRDPTDRSQPIMGANDGGSGVGVLLELARVLDKQATDQAQIWLAFFDAEDHGEIGGWPWCVGARHMADNLSTRPEYVIVVDMIGDDDQRIYYEWTGSLWLQERLWGIAAQRGYAEHFIAQHRYSILDDHTPFLQWGLPAAVIIDFDYPYWHTRYDTLDKIRADSLQRVGDVLETLLEGEPFASPATSSGVQPKP